MEKEHCKECGTLYGEECKCPTAPLSAEFTGCGLTVDCAAICCGKPNEAPATPPVSPSNSSGLLCVKPGRGCKYYEFYDSVSCLFVEGVEFMTRDEIYAAIKKDWAKLNT